MINTILAGLKGMNLQVFIDNICIATKTWSEHLVMLKKTLEIIIRANLKIKTDKCVFGANSIKFLGHEISEHGIRQDPENLKPNPGHLVARAQLFTNHVSSYMSNTCMTVGW